MAKNSSRPPIKRRRRSRSSEEHTSDRGTAIGAPTIAQRYSRPTTLTPNISRDNLPRKKVLLPRKKVRLREAQHEDHHSQEMAPWRAGREEACDPSVATASTESAKEMALWRAGREEACDRSVATASTESAKPTCKSELDFSRVFRWHDRILVVDASALDAVDSTISRMAKNAAHEFVLSSTVFESVDKFAMATHFECEGIDSNALTGEIEAGPHTGIRVAAEYGNTKSRERALALCLILAAALRRPEHVPTPRICSSLENEHFPSILAHVGNLHRKPPEGPQAIQDAAHAQQRNVEQAIQDVAQAQQRNIGKPSENIAHVQQRTKVEEDLQAKLKAEQDLRAKLEQELRENRAASLYMEQESDLISSEALEKDGTIDALRSELLAKNEKLAASEAAHREEANLCQTELGVVALKASEAEAAERRQKEREEHHARDQKALRDRLAKDEEAKAELNKRYEQAMERLKKRDKEATQNLNLRSKNLELQKLATEAVAENTKLTERATKAKQEVIREQDLKALREKKIATLEVELKTADVKIKARDDELTAEAAHREQAKVCMTQLAVFRKTSEEEACSRDSKFTELKARYDELTTSAQESEKSCAALRRAHEKAEVDIGNRERFVIMELEQCQSQKASYAELDQELRQQQADAVRVNKWLEKAHKENSEAKAAEENLHGREQQYVKEQKELRDQLAKAQEELSECAATKGTNREQQMDELKEELSQQRKANGKNLLLAKKADKKVKKAEDEVKRLREELQGAKKDDNAEDTEPPSDDELEQAPCVPQTCRHELICNVENHICDLCGNRGTAYSCPSSCDYDLCFGCFQKRSKKAKKSTSSNERIAIDSGVGANSILIDDGEEIQGIGDALKERPRESQHHSIGQPEPSRAAGSQDVAGFSKPPSEKKVPADPVAAKLPSASTVSDRSPLEEGLTDEQVLERRLVILTKIVDRTEKPNPEDLQEFMRLPECVEAIAMQRQGKKAEGAALLAALKSELEKNVKRNTQLIGKSDAKPADPRKQVEPTISAKPQESNPWERLERKLPQKIEKW